MASAGSLEEEMGAEEYDNAAEEDALAGGGESVESDISREDGEPPDVAEDEDRDASLSADGGLVSDASRFLLGSGPVCCWG